MASQTYSVTNGLHTYNIQESSSGSLSLDDSTFNDLVSWLQTNSLMETSDVTKYVLRPQETLT